jgi:hypothetical protein
LAADPIYFAKYKKYVKEFNSNNFANTKMNAIFDKNYNLILPAVQQEVAPYSYLANTSAFTNAVALLKTHVATRNQAVENF